MKLLYKKFYKRLAASAYLLVALTACSQPQDTHMNWIAKFDFFDLYQTRVNNGSFNPGSAITIKHIAIPYENTIILAAIKEESSFPNPTTQNNMIVLFASNDKGQSYREIPTGEEDLEYVESMEDYTLVQAYAMNKGVKVQKIYLFNNQTFELQKVDEYMQPQNILNYTYRDFDGKYVIKKNYETYTLLNFLDQEEFYEMPVAAFGKSFFHSGNAKIIYKKDKEIREYNVKTQEDKLLNVLKDTYDYFLRVDNQLTLQKKIFDDGDKYKYDLYDIYENKLYEYTPENKYFYRYKNFMCDYRDRSRIRYSYDYGKSWTTHKVRDFSIMQNIFGFYKDEFLVTEGVFFRGDSPESGGRVMVGEFVKP